ncbi:MAG: 3-ketoacyl-ACP reductase [Christensenellales bacterium]
MKTAIVTGGLRGIGRATALALAEHWYSVWVTGTRTPEDATEDLTELLASGIHYLRADNGVDEDHDKVVSTVMSVNGRVDLLVNNAGVAPLQRLDLLETTKESYDRLMSVNVRGPFFLTQQVARIMEKQKEGRIINISSISAEAVSVNRGEYCMSKAAMSMMTQLFAARLAPANVKVFEIRPGIIATDMTAGVKDKYDALIKNGLIPSNRWGYPQDIAKAVLMLASGDLDYATGQVIQLDGGMHIPQL